MSTQQEKLKAIADAIREKDGTTEPIAANDFPDRIRGIPSGEPVKPLDAKRVREVMRDTAWPPMPEDVPNHTIVLLLKPDSSVSFSVTSEGDYTVEVQKCTKRGPTYPWVYEVESTQTLATGATFSTTYTSETESVYRLMTISATAITGFSTGADYSSINIMPGTLELLCRLPGMGVPILQGMSDLVWVTELGAAANTGTCTYAFRDCSNLLAVICPDVMAGGNSRSNMFHGCEKLLAIDFSTKAEAGTRVNATNMFNGCFALAAIPENLLYNTNIRTLPVATCRNLREAIFKADAVSSRIIMGNDMFEDCVHLEKILVSGPHTVDSRYNVNFTKLPSLRHLIIDLPKWEGNNIDISGCAFERDGLVEMFQCLPTITTEHTITITGNPGVAELTDADKAIATAKGWTLVL